MPEPMNRYRRPKDEELKKKLSAAQYEVMVKNGTERPFSSEFWESGEAGIYVDAATGEPLFASTDQFASGCGWPSFARPIEQKRIVRHKDLSHGMVREEVRSAAGDFHLGHVFQDGPLELGGMRYCINGAALRFVPAERMEAEGYGEWIAKIKKERET